jgi:uncharacterized protein (TIGR02145 family)
MKKLLILLIAVAFTANLFSQVPEKLSYQAVIRNSSNKLVTNTNIGMQISILQSSPSGTAVYIERHFPSTNENGLVTLEIGNGTVISGSFSNINWSLDSYYIKTETDLNGGANYTITGTSQILSVPYALYAKIAESISGTMTETDPVYKGSQAAKITATNVTNLANLSGTNTGDQDLSTLATKTALGDSSAQVRSKIPDISRFITSENDPNFNASVAKGITGADTANWNNKLDAEVDGSVNNEIQNLLQVLTQGNYGGSLQIKNISDPTDAKDAATKAYVDKLLDIIQTLQNGVNDVDGNHYKTVLIGTQVWMAENLKTTKYNDGTAIPLVTDGAAWGALSTPGYCWYNNDAATYKATYGAMYNWYTVNMGKLCPTGWHVSTDAEWTTLTTYLGGTSIAGGKLKETGTAHWASPNTGATNESGFTALPGGYRYYNATYYSIGSNGAWWSSTEASTSSAWYRYVGCDYSYVYRDGSNKGCGFSVRCVRD